MTDLSLIQLIHWISMHGPYALFILLALGIIGLPIPDETLLIASGILIHKQLLPLTLTLILAPLGAMSGITVSFIMGRFISKAMILLLFRKLRWHTKYWIMAEIWFKKYGKWSLVIGYFVPGLRHLTGISAGLMELPFKQFALFAYFGAIVWSLFFIMLGYYWGNKALQLLQYIIHQYGYGITLIFAIIILGLLGISFKNFKKRMK